MLTLETLPPHCLCSCTRALVSPGAGRIAFRFIRDQVLVPFLINCPFWGPRPTSNTVPHNSSQEDRAGFGSQHTSPAPGLAYPTLLPTRCGTVISPMNQICNLTWRETCPTARNSLKTLMHFIQNTKPHLSELSYCTCHQRQLVTANWPQIWFYLLSGMSGPG